MARSIFYSRLFHYLLLCSSGMTTAGSLQAQDIRQTRISCDISGSSLKDCLTELGAKGHFRFYYNDELITRYKSLSCKASDQPMETILRELLRPTDLEFEQTGAGQVTIFVREHTVATHVEGIIVENRTNLPLSGAVVSIERTRIYALAGAMGEFSISIPDSAKETTLKITCVGYKPQRLLLSSISAAQKLVIGMENDIVGMDEVVVTGQAADISKRRISTSITSISSKDLQGIPATRIDQLLQDKLPNAQLRMTGGQAGATSIIRSRGVNSAFLNSTPIIYVDGVRLDNLNTKATLGLNLSGRAEYGSVTSALADIPLENIEKVEFINGGAATTLYGSDAANGVIQIFTRKAGNGKTHMEFSTEQGIDKATNEYLYFKRTPDLLFKDGYYQQYGLSINSGTEKNGFSFSGSYSDDNGVLIFNQNDNRKFSFRTGFRSALTDRLTYESSFSYNNSHYKRVRNGNAGQLTGVNGSGGYEGLYFTEDGASSTIGPKFRNQIDSLSEKEYAVMKAFVRGAEQMQNNPIQVNRFQTSQTFRFQVTPHFMVKAIAGLDVRMQNEKSITTNNFLSFTSASKITNQGSIDNFDRNYYGLTAELNGQQEWKSRNFSFITTFGGQFFRNEDHQVEYRGDNIRDGATTIDLAAIKTGNEYKIQVVNYGIYLQENAGFRNRIFIDIGLRGDGNSAFGKNIGAQYYPKIGISYIPSAEKYFSSLSHIFSSVKIRGSYGLSGNFPTPFSNERSIQFYGFLGDQAASFGLPGDPSLRPEKTTTFEGGMDLGLIKDRIFISAGYYHSLNRDALFFVPSAPSSGQASQLRNVGQILNRGWELAFTALPVQQKNLSLKLNFSVNTLYNRVVSSGGAAPFNINGFTARTIQTMVQEGYPIGFLRGSTGIFGPDHTLQSSNPLVNLGTTLPDVFGSAGLNLLIGKLDLFSNADYQKGAKALSFDALFRFSNKISNEGVPQQEIDKNGRSNYLNFIDRFVQNTDFIKVRNIGFTWSFNAALRGTSIQTLVAGITINNPFNFSASKFDPETTISGSSQGQGGATTGGISYATYSMPRQLLATIRIGW